jgi:hypothetical protein
LHGVADATTTDFSLFDFIDDLVVALMPHLFQGKFSIAGLIAILPNCPPLHLPKCRKVMI